MPFPFLKVGILKEFTQQIIDEFRANAGKGGGPFDSARLLLLTTTGARSGVRHTTVLGYYPTTDDRVLVVGSAGGGPKHPDWYHNLLANPRATVETGIFIYEAEAVVLRDAERDETFARLVEAAPPGPSTSRKPPARSPSSPSVRYPAARPTRRPSAKPAG